MKIADRIYMLEISADVMGKQNIVNPTLICDNNTVILVDTGYPGQLQQIREEIAKNEESFEKINTVIITHQDIDHVGNLLSIRKELPKQISVLSHEEEKPYIQGEKLPVKLAKLQSQLALVPQGMKGLYEKMKAFYETNKCAVDKTITDGEELPYCGGITVIYTPGHTPGHICLYLKRHKILIAGDALRVEKGMLVHTPPTMNLNTDMSLNSLKKLIKYDIETVICYHGGLFNMENANKRIAELANA